MKVYKERRFLVRSLHDVGKALSTLELILLLFAVAILFFYSSVSRICDYSGSKNSAKFSWFTLTTQEPDLSYCRKVRPIEKARSPVPMLANVRCSDFLNVQSQSKGLDSGSRLCHSGVLY